MRAVAAPCSWLGLCSCPPDQQACTGLEQCSKASREGGRATGAPGAWQHLGSPWDTASCAFYRERVHKHLECWCAKPISALRWSSTLRSHCAGGSWLETLQQTLGSLLLLPSRVPPEHKTKLQLCRSLLGVAVSSSQLIPLHWGAARGSVPMHTDKVIQWAAPVLGRDSTGDQQ